MKRKKTKSPKSKDSHPELVRNPVISNRNPDNILKSSKKDRKTTKKHEKLSNSLINLLLITFVSYFMTLLAHRIIINSRNIQQSYTWDSKIAEHLFINKDFVFDLNSFTNDLRFWMDPLSNSEEMIFKPQNHPVTWRIVSNDDKLYQNLVQVLKTGFRSEIESKEEILDLFEINLFNSDEISVLKLIQDNIINVTQIQLRIFLFTNITNKNLNQIHQLKSIIDSDVHYKGLGFIFYSFTPDTCNEKINFHSNFLARISLNTTVCSD